MKLLQKPIVIILLFLTLTGCGYRFGYAFRSLPGGYDQLAIPVFNNKTQFVGIEAYFTNAIREEFERSKIARVVSKKNAPVVLKGVVSRLQIVREAIVKGKGEDTPEIARLPKNTALATGIRILVTSQMELVRASDQKVLWSGNFQNEVVYSAPRIGTPFVNSANANYNHSVFHQKVAELSLVMMEEAHDRVTENF